MASLLDQLAADLARPDALRGAVATVAGVSGRRVTLTVGQGTVADVPVARTYLVPQVGDIVLVLKLDTAWLVLTALG